MEFVGVDLPRPNLAEEDVYGGGGGEDFRGRREYDSDEVEAVKLFLTGDDGVAAALGFEKLERARERERSSGVKEVRKGRGGIYSGSEKLFARRFRTNMPLTLLLRLTCVAHVLRSGDHVRSWVNR